MAVIRNILFAIALGIFFLVMIVVQPFVPLYFLIFRPTDAHKRGYHRFMQWVVSCFITHVPGVSIKIINNTQENFEKPAIVVCNHQSHLDLPAVMMLTPNVIFVAKKWVWRNPLYALIIRYADFISTEDNHDGNVAKIEKMANKGYSTVIFPEGTRSASCKVQRFHRGAFDIAQRLQMDIIPVTLYGTGKVMNKKTLFISPGKIIVHIDERIPYDPNVDFRVRTKQVKELITARYNQLESNDI